MLSIKCSVQYSVEKRETREVIPGRHELRRHEPPRFARQTEPLLCRPIILTIIFDVVT